MLWIVTVRAVKSVFVFALIVNAEKALFDSLVKAEQTVWPMLKKRAYSDALAELSTLRKPVDNFFDEVMVMTDDESLQLNRLALLAELRSLFLNIADISRLTPAQE